VSARDEFDWVAAADKWAEANWSDDGQERDRVFRDEAPAWNQRYCQTKDRALAVLASMLEHPRRKWFVAFLAGRGNRLPRSLQEPMLRAGISEPNPSDNRWLIEPCVAAMGAAIVDRPIRRRGGARCGPGGRGAGVVLGVGRRGASQRGGTHSAIGTAGAGASPLARDLRPSPRRRPAATDHPHLQLRDVSRDAEDLRALVNEAITIARAHEDEYIRHRVEVQLGHERLLQPLPPRPT
jgi:hypothetical protein